MQKIEIINSELIKEFKEDRKGITPGVYVKYLTYIFQTS